jgi:ferredoxin
MKVWVDPDKCQGHARCVQVAPDIFQQDEQGTSFTSDDDVPVEAETRVRQAERNCPERAIVITE